MAGLCGIEWKLPSLTQCNHTFAAQGFAHTHIPPTHPSVCLMPCNVDTHSREYPKGPEI